MSEDDEGFLVLSDDGLHCSGCGREFTLGEPGFHVNAKSVVTIYGGEHPDPDGGTCDAIVGQAFHLIPDGFYEDVFELRDSKAGAIVEDWGEDR